MENLVAAIKEYDEAVEALEAHISVWGYWREWEQPSKGVKTTRRYLKEAVNQTRELLIEAARQVVKTNSNN